MKRRIIIEAGHDVDWEDALNVVTQVIRDGRVSTSPNGPAYCAVTRWHKPVGMSVYSRRNKASDRFLVINDFPGSEAGTGGD